jgi:hypothetical protein
MGSFDTLDKYFYLILGVILVVLYTYINIIQILYEFLFPSFIHKLHLKLFKFITSMNCYIVLLSFMCSIVNTLLKLFIVLM